MRFPASSAALAATLALSTSLTQAAPIDVVYPVATPRLGYAFRGDAIANLPAAAAAQPRAANRPESPLVGRGLAPTPTGLAGAVVNRSPEPTQAPVLLSPNATPNEIFSFYGPVPDTDERVGPEPYKVQNAIFDWYQPEDSTPSKVVEARDDNPPVPTSQLPYPTFPADIASCQKCEPEYPKISSCAMASSAFQNGTTIFSDPTKYYSIIKCACADTFQAAYPQCLDCFQVRTVRLWSQLSNLR